MPRKKKRQQGPRRKRMTRQGRINSAKGSGWVKQHGGKNIIKSYANWFAVDLLCAVIELRMLGVNITPEREARVKTSIEARAAEKRRWKSTAAEAELEELYSESDDTFAYIAGYTPSGVPYGVTWEEISEEPPWLDDKHAGDKEGIEQCARRAGSSFASPNR